MFLLDTNVTSEVRKGSRCDANVAKWYSEADESRLFISSLSIGEIRRGIELVRRRGDLPQANALVTWLRTVMQEFSDRILNVDTAVAETWGVLSTIRPIPVIDGLLAATAMKHNLILVTRNVADVEGFGIQILNPFTPAAGGE